MTLNFHRTRLSPMLFAVAILAAGLLALLIPKPGWAATRTFPPAPNSPIAVGSSPTTVTNADFNGDGKMDLAAQNNGSNNVSVLLGNGDGTFQAKQDFAVGSGPTSVTSADFNDDTFADLAVANQNSNNVSVLLGKGDGTFQAEQHFAVGSNPTSVIAGQFNADSIVDLAVSNLYDGNLFGSVSVLLGQDLNSDGKGDGTFQPRTDYPVYKRTCNDFICSRPTTAGPNQVITADFNGDTKADLATANISGCDPLGACGPGGVSVLFGNGNGTFQDATLATSGTPVTSIDANGTGNIVATYFNSDVVSVLSYNGNGGFFAGGTFPVGDGPSAVTSGDLDGDSVDDLAVSNFNSDNVSVLKGNGGGSFQAAQNFAAGDGPAFVIGAGLNGDSFADLAVANQNSNNVSVLLNTESQPPPPETTIIKGPSGTVNSTSATFEFTSSEPGSTFQCALDDPDDAAYSPCTSPKTVPDSGSLAEGSHTFYVKATGSGGTDRTPAMRTWNVDRTAPAAPVISSPPEGGRVGSSFTVSGTAEPNSTVQLSEGTASKGSATVSSTGNWSILLSGITEGSHTYKAKATDTAGNTSAESNPRTVTVDTTASDAPVITSPAEGARLKVSSLTIAGTAEANSTVEVFEATASGDTSKGTTQVDASGAWTKTISGVSDGSHTYKAKAKDAAGNTSGFSNSRTVTVDTVKPQVSSTTPPTPLAGSTNVARGTNLTATFSEKMRTSSINTTTFKLFKVNPDGTQTQITDVVVSLSSDGLKATLNPFGAKTTLLARNTKYKGVITTGTKDLAGNSLAQQKSWTFTTKP